MRESGQMLTAVRDPLLDESIEVGPERPLASWRLSVPAKPACYLLEDGAGRPVLLTTVGNLRRALERRLGPAEAAEAAEAGERSRRKIDYRAVVRRVRWRSVFSRFEADWAYLENARRVHPRTYRRLVRRMRAHWIGIDLDEAHPRFAARPRPFRPAASCFGPLPTAKAARRCIEALEDVFDLCRYHHILVRAPHGNACVYKDMGRCPAPCDGTAPMEEYRGQLREAVGFLGHPGAWLEGLEGRMKRAAAELDFEAANRHKQRMKRAAALRSPEAARLRPLEAFAYVSIQRGQRKRWARVFLIGRGPIELAGEVGPKDRDPAAPGLAALAERAGRLVREQASGVCDDAAAQERIGLAGWHLLNEHRGGGLFLPAGEAMDPGRLAEAVDRVAEATPRSASGAGGGGGAAEVGRAGSMGAEGSES